MRPRRESFELAKEILERAKEGRRKTSIMYSCNLSFTETRRYLGALVDANFIVITDGLYKTTPQGVNAIQKVKETLESFRPFYESLRK